MSNGTTGAGVLPAFVDYAELGGGYALMAGQVHNRRLVHAYLFAGPKGVGKRTFALFLTASLFCESPDKPCGTCEACRRVFTGNEPDVLELASTEDRAISIERAREIIARISQHSFGTGPRVVLVEPFERLTPPAQNCLLKSLEEPPADVIFFLLAHEPSALLGTIASRCAVVKLPPWPDAVLRRALQNLGYPVQRVDAALPRSGGNIGAALSILEDAQGEGELVSLVRRALSASSDAEMVALSTGLKDDRGGADVALTALEQAFHQALLARTGVLPAASVSDPLIRDWAAGATTETLSALLAAVFETRKRRQSQVNWQASIDRLLMKILEAKTRWQPL